MLLTRVASTASRAPCHSGIAEDFNAPGILDRHIQKNVVTNPSSGLPADPGPTEENDPNGDGGRELSSMFGLLSNPSRSV